MKYLMLISILVSAATSHALELACWNVYSKRGSRPYFTAKVLERGGLTDLRLNNNPDGWDSNLKLPEERIIEPTLITSNRSPYKGNNEYWLGNARLILPADLTPEALKAKTRTGIGLGGGENAVIIGDMEDGDGAGSHYSIRMRCTSR